MILQDVPFFCRLLSTYAIRSESEWKGCVWNRQVFGGYVRFDVYLGVSVVRQAAQVNDIDYSWINSRPTETKLTGED